MDFLADSLVRAISFAIALGLAELACRIVTGHWFGIKLFLVQP